MSLFLLSSRGPARSDTLPDLQPLIYGTEFGHRALLSPIPLPDLIRTLRGARVLLVLHGFNNSFWESVDNFWHVQEGTDTHLAGIYEHILGYTWPSSRAPNWWEALRNVTLTAGPFLRLIFGLEPDLMDVMTHSLGARTLLSGLVDLPPGLVFRNAFLTAPAVDDESCQFDEVYFPATQRINNLYVLHSERDGVLSYAYRAGQLDSPLGLHGPQDRSQVPGNMRVVDCERVIGHHGAYWTSADVYRHMSEWIQQPPSKRFLRL